MILTPKVFIPSLEEREREMGNTESSSQFPARPPAASRGRDETESESESSLEKALKVGAAVAGGALLALGAYSLASSSSSSSSTSDGSDDRKPANQTESVTVQGSYGSPSAPRDRDETESESSLKKALKVGAAVAGGALLAFGAYSLASSSSSSSTSDSDERKATNHTERSYGSSRSAGDHAHLPHCPSHLGDMDEHSSSGTIKIMTYNIWLREDVQVQERMNAIGKLIQEHSPDIILLQEVTPNIYEIFQSSYWSNVYKFSVPEEKATRKNFCMLLSKLPLKKSTCIPFKSSNDGKELCVSWIKTGKNKLIVSTCHLKRPTNSEETNSTERVAQAKEAISMLKSLPVPNIVLGGDMNWNEDSDGPFPLVGKWKDAWSVLRPDEDGWTYDTKSNGMLRSSEPLQRRLDRFLCKMKDFKLVDIDMIGLDPIPQISYKKKPVYPSDHYGLILTVQVMHK